MKNKISDLLIFIFIAATGIIVTLTLGQDANWDLAAYHYYSVYALFNDRIGFDIMPCGIQSYFNPLIYVPFYILIKFFNNYPQFIAGCMSIWWSISVFLIYKISGLIFIGKYKNLSKTFSVIVGATGILSFLEIGTTFGDVIITTFILLALFLFLKYLNEIYTQDGKILIFISSLIIGAAAGLKLTAVIFILGFVSMIIFRINTPPPP